MFEVLRHRAFRWIWIGALVCIGGTLVCLVPSKVKMQYARTEVVGITKKHAKSLTEPRA